MFPTDQFQLSDEHLRAKEGEQCRWTGSYCKLNVDGKKTCQSSQQMQYCKEGLKCKVDPNDPTSSFCRKEGTGLVM